MSPDPRFLVWCDLETTGTDESLDSIIEVGLVLTDFAPILGRDCPWVALDEATWVVKPPDDSLLRLVHNPFVRGMHKANGLLDDILDGETAMESDEVDGFISDFLSAFGKPHQFMLAGSGVSHFDRRFISAQLPLFSGFLQYPNFDVGVVRRFLRSVCPTIIPPSGDTTVAGTKTHRALDDVRVHLAEANFYANTIFARDPSTPSTIAAFSGVSGERREV